MHWLWQLDFKESVDIAGVGPTTISQARDVEGRATVLHRIYEAGQVGESIVKLTTEQVQADSRHALRSTRSLTLPPGFWNSSVAST